MLPSASPPVPSTWRELLEELAPVFRRRSTYRLFVALACGMILADRSTVVAMAAAAGMAGKWRRACWFFSGAVWDIDALGLAAARLIVKHLLGDGEAIVVAADGTFFKRWGRRVAQARWAYDGSVQGGKKIAFGNTWVIVAIVVRLPFCSSPAALPVLFRLWRGKDTASQVELAAEMVRLLVGAFPGRPVHGTGDAAFHGEPLVIEDATWTTRLPANAVLYGPKPPPTGKRGRPRVKGPGWEPALRSPRTRTGRTWSSTSTGKTPPCRSPPPQGCGTAASRAHPAASSWSGPPALPGPTTWACTPPIPLQAPLPSPSGTPGGGRSSRRTRRQADPGRRGRLQPG
jgi:DDE superfamily endonuclease